jgi:hypothetical protein
MFFALLLGCSGVNQPTKTLTTHARQTEDRKSAFLAILKTDRMIETEDAAALASAYFTKGAPATHFADVLRAANETVLHKGKYHYRFYVGRGTSGSEGEVRVEVVVGGSPEVILEVTAGYIVS